VFTTTTNATPIPPTNAAASSVSQHRRRLGSMGKTKRRPSGAREASASDVRFCFFLFFASFLYLSLLFGVCVFCVCWCIFLGFPFRFPVFVFFGFPFPCLILSFLARFVLVPALPLKNVLRSTFGLPVSIFSPLSPPFPPTMFGFLTFV